MPDPVSPSVRIAAENVNKRSNQCPAELDLPSHPSPTPAPCGIGAPITVVEQKTRRAMLSAIFDKCIIVYEMARTM